MGGSRFKGHRGNESATWKRAICALLPVVLSACAVHSETGGTVTIHADPGGSITGRMVDIAEKNASGKHYRIAGHCISACTMYLGLDRVCVEPDARLEFHSPHKVRGMPGVLAWAEEMRPDDHRVYVAQMAQHYPPNIRTAFVAEWSRMIHTHHKMTGMEAHRMDPDHVALCR